MPDRTGSRQAAVRTAVISGAARGFGAALCSILLADGWTVYGIVRPGSPVLDGAAARRLEWDISLPCPPEVAAALARARIDVVVNNAAVGSSQNSLFDVDPDAVTAALNHNVAGFGTSYSYRLSKAALNMLTLNLHEEFGGQLDVWSVHPGILKTDMGRTGAAKDPVAAARELLSEMTSQSSGGPSARSGQGPRFLDLGSRRDLPW